MLTWDQDFLRKLILLGFIIKIYKRFVDDITVFLAGINPGWYYDKNNDKMAFDHTNDLVNLSTEVRTSTILGEIANTIDPNIKVTIDSPSCNSNGKVPILDIEVWVEDNRINHSFYRKPIASQFFMRKGVQCQPAPRETLYSRRG